MPQLEEPNMVFLPGTNPKHKVVSHSQKPKRRAIVIVCICEIQLSQFKDPVVVNVPVKLDDACEGEGNYEGQEPTDEAKEPTAYSVGEMKLQMLDPHDVLHYVHTQLGLTVQPESVRSYWRQAKANGAGWAIVQDNLDAIPVGIYADETKYGLHESQEKILAVFLNLVLFRPKNIRLSRFLLCSIRSKFLLPGTDTLIPIFNRIVWSMGWAAKGFFPTSGLLGAGLSSYQEALSENPWVANSS